MDWTHGIPPISPVATTAPFKQVRSSAILFSSGKVAGVGQEKEKRILQKTLWRGLTPLLKLKAGYSSQTSRNVKPIYKEQSGTVRPSGSRRRKVDPAH